MQELNLKTLIDAPRERVFDLARSIDAHQASTKGTQERAVAGVTSGLIGLNDEVTWEARHFGIRLQLRVRVTEFDRPNHFQDIMVSGNFQSMVHDHDFHTQASGTLMTDRFVFASPFGVLGGIIDVLFLARYMRRFLIGRNDALKTMAESQLWRKYVRQ
jgi:ligand-binding SRPBCC domain-containing protein